MDLKIEMLKSMFRMNKKEHCQVEHSPDERSLVIKSKSYECRIIGDLYDKLNQADTMFDVLDIYEESR